MTAFTEQIGQQMATSATSGAAASAGGEIMGWAGELLLGNRRRKKQIEQQKKLTEIQVEANKELARHGVALQKEMFEATGYGAQRRQMEEAGLNPALMYGQAGAGGQLGTGQGGGTSTGQASDEASMMNAITNKMAMGLQLAMQKAQIRNIEADTKQKEAEAEKTATVDTELTKISIEDITETINNKKVQKEGILLDNDLKILEYTVMHNTTQDRANEIKYRAKSAKETLIELQRNNEIGDATKQQIIDSYQLKLQDIATEIILKETNAQVNREQAKKIIQDVKNSIEELRLKGEQIEIEKETNRIKESYPGLNQLGGATIQELIFFFDKLNPIGGKGKGFRK